MAEKTIIENYKKSETQSEYEKKTFIEPLRDRVRAVSGKSRNIILPQYICFKIQEDKKLFINIEEQKGICAGEEIVLNATCKNMQTDNAAFEGWAVCLKAWLPEVIESVELKWDVPKERNEHYNRFCYRVMKMKESFDWFSIANLNQREIDTFQECLNNLQNNCGNKIPEKKFKHGGRVGENAVEYDMVHEQNFPQLLCNHYNIPKIHHQLPVGVKQDGNSFFAGSKAAIDLWGMNENELTIIELKYENEMVGIISELFFYASLMRDIVLGRISKPNAILPHEKALYKNIEKMSVIHARMLADVYHPLVDYEHVFMLLNDNQLKDVKIDFDKSLYSYIPSTLKFQ